MSIYLWFLLLAALGYAIAGPRPTSMAFRQAVQEERSRRHATAHAAHVARQAFRRRLFGSHPVLYWALVWASPVVLIGLLAWFMEP